MVVRPGDCLWTIARDYLGSGDLYPVLIRLNLGHDMGDGQVFTNPSLIMPGWELNLPDGTADSGGHPGSPTGPDRGHHARHASARQPGHHHGHPSGNGHFRDPHNGAGDGAGGGAGAGAGARSGRRSRGRSRRRQRDRCWRQSGDGFRIRLGPARPGSGSATGIRFGARQASHASGQQEEVQQVVLFTLGMIAGAALVCLERLRHRQRQHRRFGRRIALPADADSQRIERKLRAAAPPAPPASLRDALCDLSAGVAESGDPLPPIVGIHLTPDSIDVLLSAPAAAPPPPPFSIAPGRQGMCWTTALTDVPSDWAASPPKPGEVGDLLPGLFTAGATDGGYLLLDLEAMRVTCCDGPADLTDRLLVTAATELASSRWSGWYELILAGCDELDVLGRADRCRDLDEALDVLETRVSTIDRRLRDDRQADVRSRRMEDPEDEDWGLTLLVSRLQPTPDQMTRLLDLSDGPGGVAALVAGDTQAADGKLAPAVFRLEADPDGPGGMVATITLAYLGPRSSAHRPAADPDRLGVRVAGGAVRDRGRDFRRQPGGARLMTMSEGPPWMRFAAAPVLAGSRGGAGSGGQLRGYWNSHSAAQACRNQTSQPGERIPAGNARSDLSVNVLGTFEVLGSAEPLQPKQAELVLALALARPDRPVQLGAVHHARRGRRPPAPARFRQAAHHQDQAAPRPGTRRPGVHRSPGQRHLRAARRPPAGLGRVQRAGQARPRPAQRG